MARWPRGDKRCTRHATGGTGDAAGAQGDVIPEVCAVAAGPGGLERERGGHAESHVVDAGGLFALDDRGERPALATGNARWEVGSGAVGRSLSGFLCVAHTSRLSRGSVHPESPF